MAVILLGSEGGSRIEWCLVLGTSKASADGRGRNVLRSSVVPTICGALGAVGEDDAIHACMPACGLVGQMGGSVKGRAGRACRVTGFSMHRIQQCLRPCCDAVIRLPLPTTQNQRVRAPRTSQIPPSKSLRPPVLYRSDAPVLLVSILRVPAWVQEYIKALSICPWAKSGESLVKIIGGG